MRSFVERELKLEPKEGFSLPDLPGEPIEPRLFTSTYYDTPGHSLSATGITLRRRVENGLSSWQLKLPRDGSARLELQAPGGPAGPPEPLAELLMAHLRRGPVAPIATLRTRRSGTRVGDNGRTVAEVTLDSVVVLDAGRSSGAFEEIEVELVDGDDRDLKRLGRTLRHAGAKRSDGVPKVLRVLSPPPRVEAPHDASTAELLRALLSEQLRELLRHDPGVRLGDDPEDVHQYRVATRRARALIRATTPLLGDRLTSLGKELKWLAGLLGPVRDRDVLILRLTESVRMLDHDGAGGEALVAQLDGERAQLLEELREALNSERYLQLIDAFDSALVELRELKSHGKARKIARKSFKELLHTAKELPQVPTDAELHGLRIAAKRARYSAELEAKAGGTKKLRRYLDSLKNLQDLIGEHQDAAVAELTLRKLARAKTGLAAGRLIECERLRRAEQRRLYPAALSNVLDRGRRATG